MSLRDLTADSVTAWKGLGVMAIKDSTMQIQRGGKPVHGESYWVFNRGEAVELKGQKSFDLDPSAWKQSFIDNAWVMTGPPTEAYLVPDEGVQVWTWDGDKRIFILIPPGGKLPAGSAAWFWQ